MASLGKPRFFAKPDAFGKWLAANHSKRTQLLVGYWKVGTGKPSMTWAESVEQALGHGWIDGVRRSLGDEAYCIRFTPRRRGSNWSNVNLRLAKKLIAQGRMTLAGAAAYDSRRKDQQPRGSYEQSKPVRLSAADTRRFRKDGAAWAWFRDSAPSYQRACAWWIQSATKPATRERRLALLMKHAHRGEVVPAYTWSKAGRAKTKSGTSN